MLMNLPSAVGVSKILTWIMAANVFLLYARIMRRGVGHVIDFVRSAGVFVLDRGDSLYHDRGE